MKSVKPVEVVTFPGTGFFSKPLMGSVITRGNLMVDRVEHGEGERQSCFVLGPRSYPLPCLYLEPDRYETGQLLSVGPYCQGLCLARGLRVQSSLNLIIRLFHSTTSYPTTLSRVTCGTSGSSFFLPDVLLGSLPEIFLQGSPDPFLWIWVHLPNQVRSGSPDPNPAWSPCCYPTLVILNNPSLIILSNPRPPY